MSTSQSPTLSSSTDSAFGSTSGNRDNNNNNRRMERQPAVQSQSQLEAQLELARKEQRHKASMLARIVRTELPHLNGQHYVSKSCRSISFQVHGRLDGQTCIPRPMSILWPDTELSTIRELQKLDTYLVETNFTLSPVEWMLANELTSKPECRRCKKDMILIHNEDTSTWHCPFEFGEHCAPVQRPSCFDDLEDVDLMRLLFAIYHWSICTPFECVLEQMKLDSETGHLFLLLWQRLQRVCVTALEKTYPRFRLYSNPDGNSDFSEPIDLIFIKLNKMKIVCAKHPKSNCVRLGCFNNKIPTTIQSWFAHGSQIRVCQSRLLDLKKSRTDLEIKFVPLAQMVLTNDVLNQDSAFGYLLALLTNALKEFNTSTLSNETIRYLLAEAEWREFYGTSPYDAFKNIVHHISQFFKPSQLQSDASESEGSPVSSHGSEYLTTLEICEGLRGLEKQPDYQSNVEFVLTPNGLPAKCIECMEYITDSHYKSSMRCKYCPYKTHCPMAADNHHVLKHNELDR